MCKTMIINNENKIWEVFSSNNDVLIFKIRSGRTLFIRRGTVVQQLQNKVGKSAKINKI